MKLSNMVASAVLGVSMALSPAVTSAQDTVKKNAGDTIKCVRDTRTAAELLEDRTKEIVDGKVYIVRILRKDGDIIKTLVPYEEALADTQKALDDQKAYEEKLGESLLETRNGRAVIAALSRFEGCLR